MTNRPQRARTFDTATRRATERHDATKTDTARHDATARDMTGRGAFDRTLSPVMVGASTSGFAHRPAGTPDLGAELQCARDRVAELRRDLGELQTTAAHRHGAGLVELDIGRALAALMQADLALRRAHRHVDLEAQL